MTKHVSLGQWIDKGEVKLDLARLLLTRLLLQANSGAGKSWAFRRLLEVTAGLVQQIIIDPEGEFASLREKHDLVIVSASGGDALAHPKTAALLGRRLLETGASAVLDISDLKAHERHSFVRLLLESLIEAPKSLRHPVLVALDEMQLFCPEKGQGESEAGPAVIDLAARGRKRGLCLVGAVQRISMLHKGVAAECKNRMIGGTSLDVDVKRAAFDLGLPPQEALKILRALEPGHFYAFGPAFHQLQPREFVTGEVHTSHPKVGHRQEAPPAPTAAILALLPQLADLPKEAEQQAKSMEDLRRELAQTKRELTLAKKAQPASIVASPEVLKTAEKRGFETGVAKATREWKEWAKHIRRATHEAVDTALKGAAAEVHVDHVKWSDSFTPPRTPAVERVPLNAGAKRALTGNGHDANVSGVQQRILNALAELEALNSSRPPRELVALLADYTNVKSTGFVKAMSTLSSAGLIEYPSAGEIALTDAGRAVAQAPDQPRTTEELQARIMDMLGGATSRILKPLVEAYPEAMDRQAVAEAAGYGNLKSTGFVKALSQLSTLGFIRYPNPGSVAAKPVLFLEGM